MYKLRFTDMKGQGKGKEEPSHMVPGRWMTMSGWGANVTGYLEPGFRAHSECYFIKEEEKFMGDKADACFLGPLGHRDVCLNLHWKHLHPG